MSNTVVLTPASNPLQSQNVYDHLRLLGTPPDAAYIQTCMDDAFAFAATETEASLGSQNVQTTYYDYSVLSKQAARLGTHRLYLPLGPVTSINSITANGHTLASNSYTLGCNGNSDYVEINGLPATPVVITYTAGYSTLPNDLRRAMLNHIGSMYAMREAHQGGMPEVDLQLCRIYERYRRTRGVI